MGMALFSGWYPRRTGSDWLTSLILVAEETREGDAYRTLLEKLEEARKALGGQVFDVLGKRQFEGRSLRDLLSEAVRYGESPGVHARLTRVVANAVDWHKLEDLLEDRALARGAMDASRVRRVREDMERADAAGCLFILFKRRKVAYSILPARTP